MAEQSRTPLDSPDIEREGLNCSAKRALAEVEAFRRAKPAAARSIRAPLAEYEQLLREVRDHPEQRLR